MGDRTTINAPSGTTTLTYDQNGRLTTYGTSATYTYDGDGLRMSKKIGHTSESFVWGSSGPGATPRLLVDGSTDYVYGPGGLPLEQVSGTTVLYYLHDQLGSTRALTSSSGSVVATYTYDPYGNVTGSTGTVTNPVGFAGAYTDSESGFIYLQNRYYDPATAQFISSDPLVDATEQPFAYAADNPLAYTDPAGLGLLGDILGGLGIALGLAAAATGVGAVIEVGVGVALEGAGDALAAEAAAETADTLTAWSSGLGFGAAAADIPSCYDDPSFTGCAGAIAGAFGGAAGLGDLFSILNLGDLWPALSEGLGVFGTSWDALNYWRTVCATTT